MAFSCDNRGELLERIMVFHQKKRIEKNIADLKPKLFGNKEAPNGFDKKVFQEIQELYRKLSIELAKINKDPKETPFEGISGKSLDFSLY